ncbi:hypothetical protein RJ55_06894 [Drechmeria coniospora]|nr:hypothetical protein RJ55_06894 [Drechmeria coniospora]
MRITAVLPTITLAFAFTRANPTEPKPSESIEISKLIVRKYVSESGTAINVVDFKLAGNDGIGIECTARNPAFPTPNEVTTCGNSKYRFSLHSGNAGSEFSLRVYHELGTAVGYYGQGNVPTYCHAGGDGPGDYVCFQIAPVVIVIDSTSPPVHP